MREIDRLRRNLALTRPSLTQLLFGTTVGDSIPSSIPPRFRLRGALSLRVCAYFSGVYATTSSSNEANFTRLPGK